MSSKTDQTNNDVVKLSRNGKTKAKKLKKDIYKLISEIDDRTLLKHISPEYELEPGYNTAPLRMNLMKEVTNLEYTLQNKLTMLRFCTNLLIDRHKYDHTNDEEHDISVWLNENKVDYNNQRGSVWDNMVFRQQFEKYTKDSKYV